MVLIINMLPLTLFSSHVLHVTLSINMMIAPCVEKLTAYRVVSVQESHSYKG